MHITMVGTGYVGLVTGTCFAEIGHKVICVDSDLKKISMLKDGRSPIYEPGLEVMMQRNMAQQRLSFDSDLSQALTGCSVCFIAVGTPENEDGSADLSYVKAVASSIGRYAKGDLMVVIKLTVPVGTADIVGQIIAETLAGRKVSYRITVASNPEFLKEGDAISDFMRPDRIVVGVANEQDGQAFRAIYKPFIMDDPSKLLVMDLKSSELTKYAANAMLATRISFMNEISELCEIIGADVEYIRRGIGADTRIGKKFLYAGPGYGGSCFPKDVKALINSASEVGVNFTILNAVSKANERQKNRSFRKIKSYFGDMTGKTVAIWGLSFKPATDDVREAPAAAIIEQLLQAGARIQAHDPQAIASFKRNYSFSSEVKFFTDAYEALKGAHAMVLVTEWSEYRRPDWQLIKQNLADNVVFDLRNQYEPAFLAELGFHYEGIGRHSAKSGK